MEEVESSSRPPVWFRIVRGLQLSLSVIILALSAYLNHGFYFSQLGFTIALSVLTWIFIAYNYSTLFASSLTQYRIPLVILIGDAFMVICWLAALAATATLRASFKYSVDVEDCYNNGNLINSNTCIVDRSIEKRRFAVVSRAGLSMMSAIAGLSALEMLLFIACLVFGIIAFMKSGSSDSSTAYPSQKQNEGYPMESPQQPYVHQTYAQEPYAQAPQPTHQPYVQQSYEHQPNIPIH